MSAENDRIRVLLVDDHVLVLQGLRALLDKQPEFEVVGEAGEGEAAVSMALQLKPDVILLDIELPDIDGIEVTRRLMKENPSLKILALSRHSERGFVSKMFKCGALGYILKDSAIEELIEAIKTLYQDQKYLSPSLIDVVLDESEDAIPAQQSAKLEKLTTREREVLKHIAGGNTSKEIAFQLNLSAKTVDAHRYQIMHKLGIDNIADLTRFAIREGLIEL